jgi:PadR family transcriptional regulator PadR
MCRRRDGREVAGASAGDLAFAMMSVAMSPKRDVLPVEVCHMLACGTRLTSTPSSSMHRAVRHKGPERIGKDLVAASASALVLGILNAAPNYGYAIIQRVRELSGGALEWSEGMLYPVLHRLEDQGLIESFEEKGESGRKRKYYRLRADGKRALAEERRQWDVVHAALAKAWRPA